ncbi:MAG: hypothetical protein GX801_11545 [Fibrobacter sp.]|nr:hypothetical protein [Fibrobacter sp.]
MQRIIILSMFLALSSWAANVDTLFVTKDRKINDKFAINSAFDSIAVSKTDGEYQLGLFKGQNAVKNISINAVDSIVFYRLDFTSNMSSSSSADDTLLVKSNSTITDARDGNVYNVVEIGDQTWMAENLSYLPGVDGIDTSNTDPKYYVYGYTGTDTEEAKAASNYQKFGALYNWPAALEACPVGWHLPTNAEWKTLEIYVGGYFVAGKKLKSTNYGGTDQYGFGALPGGSFYSGEFLNVSNYGRWWSATEGCASFVNRWSFLSYDDRMTSSTSDMHSGFSVRCVKGQKVPTKLSVHKDKVSAFEVGNIQQLHVSVLPNSAVNKNIIWSSEDPSIATVNQNGKVEAKALGLVTIKVETEVGGLIDSVKIKVLENFIDERDHNAYSYIRIGTQTWMAENLRYLPSLNGVEYSSESPKYYVYGYNGTDVEEAKATDYYQKYGVMYNWPAALEACPAGWHLPTDEEWSVLEDYAGDSLGVKLKADNGWFDWNCGENGKDQYGFGLLPGGHFTSGDFYNESSYGYWWSATEYSASSAFSRYLIYLNDIMNTGSNGKNSGFSVRCVED